jgi:glycosyltransferase involved in cell wall biosynthesis
VSQGLHVLAVSSILHQDPERRVSGAAQRLDMLIEAVSGLGTLDVLFFVPNHTDISPRAVEREERRLSDRWRTDLTLGLVHLSMQPWQRPTPHFMSVLVRSLAAGAISWQGMEVGVKASFRPQLRAIERFLDRGPDLVLAHKPTALAPLLLTRRRLPPLVYDMDDLEHVKLAQQARQRPWHGRVLPALGAGLLRWQATCALKRATATLVCAAGDRARLSRWAGGERVQVVPNALAPRPALPLPSQPVLLFLGTYWYRPNRDAAEYLVRTILPLVRAASPAARLIIAGERPETLRSFADRPAGVEFAGFVEDLDELYARSRVVVAPLLSGSGTRIKIIEAALYGRPVVSTTVGAAGLDVTDGREVLIADTPEAFAAACLELLEDDSKARDLTAAASALVLARYDRAKVVAELRQLLRDVATSTPSKRPPRSVVLIGGTTEPGGLHRHTTELCEELAARGERATILALHADHFSRFARGPLTIERTRLTETGNALWLLLRWWRQLAPFAGSTFVYCRGSGGGGSVGLLMALWLRGASVMTIEHRVPDAPLAHQSRFTQRLAARLVHRAVAVSEAVRQAVIELGAMPAERVVTATNWVDHRRFAPDRAAGAALRQRLGLGGETLVLGYLGRLAPEKRVDLLLRGLARARNCLARPTVLLVVGGGWKRAELQVLACELELGDIVRFVGEQDDPIDWYRGFDFLVLPSLLEGMPLVALEAMATATPVLMHDIPVAREIIEDGHTGLVRTLMSAAGMAVALAEMARLPKAQVEAMGSAARRRMIEAHDPATRIPALAESIGIRTCAAAR